MRPVVILFLISAVQLLITGCCNAKPAARKGKNNGKSKVTPAPFVAVRIQRSLPSVSDDHYQEMLPDGTYKYAYTNQNTYHVEKRSADGTVEGETVVIRPDGVPVKTHYIADRKGYRPKIEVLYTERVVINRKGKEFVVPDQPTTTQRPSSTSFDKDMDSATETTVVTVLEHN